MYLEEDLILSPDALDLTEWYDRNQRSTWMALNLLCGPCGTAGYVSSPWFPETLVETKMFNSLGFATHRHMWENFISKVWMAPGDGEQSRPANWDTSWGWDWSVYAFALSAPVPLFIVSPAFSRVNHIGTHGVHVTPAHNEKMFGSLEINCLCRGRYVLEDIPSLPHELKSHIYALIELSDLHWSHAFVDRQLREAVENRPT
ncbi:hypothetical protein ACRBEV_22650 [Methylobacterium phyllosphaerae]